MHFFQAGRKSDGLKGRPILYATAGEESIATVELISFKKSIVKIFAVLHIMSTQTAARLVSLPAVLSATQATLLPRSARRSGRSSRWFLVAPSVWLKVSSSRVLSDKMIDNYQLMYCDKLF